MRKYHHYGIPTKEAREDETLVEVGGFKFYSTPFESNKWHIEELVASKAGVLQRD